MKCSFLCITKIDIVILLLLCTHLVNPQYCDGSVGGQFDAPVFDQIRLQHATLQHVLQCGTFTLQQASHRLRQSTKKRV